MCMGVDKARQEKPALQIVLNCILIQNSSRTVHGSCINNAIILNYNCFYPWVVRICGIDIAIGEQMLLGPAPLN